MHKILSSNKKVVVLLAALAFMLMLGLPDLLFWLGINFDPMAFMYSGCNSLAINAEYGMRLLIAAGYLILVLISMAIVRLIDKNPKRRVSYLHFALLGIAVAAVVLSITIKPNCNL